MKQVAIIPQEQHDIGRELSDCIARLENSGIRVFAARRGHGYAILWAEDPVISRGAQVLSNAGFAAAPLIGTRIAQIRTQSGAHQNSDRHTIVSN
jgi:hypothetical protein